MTADPRRVLVPLLRLALFFQVLCVYNDILSIAQNHIPIDIQFNIEALPNPPCKRFALQKLDRAGLTRSYRLYAFLSTLRRSSGEVGRPIAD